MNPSVQSHLTILVLIDVIPVNLMLLTLTRRSLAEDEWALRVCSF